MPFVHSNGLRFFRFGCLEGRGVRQAIFTRQGGVSPNPWNSLNLGGTVGDTRENVVENRRRCFEAFDRPVESIFDVWQVHSADVRFAETPRPLNTPHQKADIILTDNPSVTLMMRFADCVPIFLYDPVRRVIGLAHAGWKGTVQRVAEVAVRAMVGHYGSRPGDILAGIGPSISVERYPVGEEVVQEIQNAFGDLTPNLLVWKTDQAYLNLWEANRLALWTAGVQNIEIAGVCTAGQNQDWFSHRGDSGKTGRFGAFLALEG